MLAKIGLAFLTVVLLAPGAVRAARGRVPELARRCNEVRWDSRDFDTPPALESIRKELIAAGKTSLDAIEGSLPHSPNLRRMASSVVAEWPCDQARTILLRLLADEDTRVAENAAFYLGSVGGKEVYDALLGVARNRSGMVRHNALNSLSQLGLAHRACDVAIECLSARESWVRHSAASLLGGLSVSGMIDRAIPAVEAMIAREQDPGAKAAAAQTLRVLRARRGS